MSSNKRLQAVQNIGKALALILAVFSTLSYMISMTIGPILFFSTTDGLTVAARQIHQIPIDVFMVITIPVPVGVNLGVLFAGIWAFFAACFIFAWLSRGGFVKAVRDVLSKSVSVAKMNFLFIMPLIACGLLYATVLIDEFQATQGVQTGSLNFPPATSPYLILLELAFAPLREEFAFRITSIGIPLGIALLFLFRSDPKLAGPLNKAKLFLLAMLSPDRAKLKLGYRNVSTDGFWRGISPLEWALILVTGFAFGTAHLLFGGGWEVGKVTTAFMAGVVFGVVYVAYGAYAPILLHWFFNYYFTALDMGASTYGGVFQTFTNFSEVTALAVGQVVLVVFLLVTALKVSDSLTLRAAGMGASSS
ncbi:MAG: CPBP family intramembrane glutamic endopeptidase [Candidatus Bathyarchaeia archaeon]